MIEHGKILHNKCIKGDYYRVDFHAPGICAYTKPGQFVHVRISELRHRILRRPFSIFDVDPQSGAIAIIYKIVGEGTEMLSTLKESTSCDLMGPIGKPFSLPGENEIPMIVAGGYGAAATFLLSKKCHRPGIVLLGAKNSGELILQDEFRNLGFDVKTATEDGSDGYKGLVTGLLKNVIQENFNKKIRFYGCGPYGMLMAMGKVLLDKGFDAELSFDHKMCCGLGACFACVIKIKDCNDAAGWRYARTCSEGPVFKASQVYYD